MNSNRNYLKSPLVWTLAAGFAIGAASVATIPKISGSTQSSLSSTSTPVKQPPKPVTSLSVNSMEALRSINDSLAALAKAAEPAVVHIKVESRDAVNMFGGRQTVGGEGSGFIFRPDGYIVTNDHVAGGFDKVTVILHDGREFTGRVIRAEESDIAVIKIDATDLPTLPFANSSTVQPGEFAMAIGAPFGLDSSVTIGHVSAVGRVHQIPDGRSGVVRQYGDMIQTDAQINMGNSGGPLINIDGEVIGINTAIFTTTGSSNGVGFAISSNQARYLAETLIEKGKVERGYLGVNPENLKEFQQKELGLTEGAILTKVESDSPAAMAGLKVGDVVVRVGSVKVTNQADLRNSMFRYGPDSRVDIEFVRDGVRKTVEAKLVSPKKEDLRGPTRLPSGQQLPPGLDLPDIKGFEDQLKQAPGIPNGQPRLGVQVQDLTEDSRKQFSVPENVVGAVVATVEPGSLADKVLNMQPGDVIQQFGDDKISRSQQLVDLVRGLKSGDKRIVQYRRFNGKSVFTYTYNVAFR
jgi:serine protease Do